MAIISFPGITWPPHFQAIAGAPSLTSTTLTVINDKMAILWQAPRTGTVYQIGYAMQTVTTNNNTTLTVEGVTTSTGLPDGSNVAGSNTTNTHTVGWNVKTTASSFSVIKGQWYALVITNTGTASIGFRSLTDGESFNHFRKFTASGSTWAGLVGGAVPIGLNYSNGGDDWDWPDPSFGPNHTDSSLALSTSQTWDEAGVKFEVPVSCRISGCIVWADVNVDAVVTLYDSSDTVLSTGTYYAGLPPNSSVLLNRVTFDTDATLAANATYRLTFKSTNSTSNNLYFWTATDATVLAQFHGNIIQTTRKSSGAWTDTATTRPYIYLALNGIDVSSGSGGTRALSFLT